MKGRECFPPRVKKSYAICSVAAIMSIEASVSRIVAGESPIGLDARNRGASKSSDSGWKQIACRAHQVNVAAGLLFAGH